MSSLCVPTCCTSCKPRYKRLVDSIYPRTHPFDAPLGTSMQKLTFYSISHPEKLNRIGIYLVQRLSRDLTRQRFAEVKVTVDAMDRLLKSCHGSPSLNQFIESYLLMVQRLMETNNPHMEKLATDLFVRFSGIEEDSPSYHRQYDFFISKFSAMCHAQQGGYVRSQRFNGLRGLRGVIWKSASDDLQANIWEKQHMNKIVPSILFNFQQNDDCDEPDDQDVGPTTEMLFHHYPEEQGITGEAAAEGEVEPRSLALQCLRELFQKCSFGSLKSVLEPVFKHFDLHHKWDPPATFAIKTFKAILYSIQSQNSYFVIQELINQLELQPTTGSTVRVGMATVLASIVSIAGTSIGPLLLAIFNSLLKQLRSSVEFQQSRQCTDLSAERAFQDTLINALGDFANALPDYQKVEIMMFTASTIPTIIEGSIGTTTNENTKMVQTSEAFLQKVLVKTLLEVATKYKTFYLATVFTDAFLKTLFQLQLTRDPEVRLIAQRIFHTLLDRRDNQAKLEHIPFVPDLQMELQLSVEKCSRQDQLFMRRHIHVITSTLYRSVNLAECNQSVPLETQLDVVLCSMALLCVEVGNDETVIELLRLAFALQQMALDSLPPHMSSEKTAGVHNSVAKFMNLCSQLLSIPALCQHVQQVIKARAQRAHPLLNIVNGPRAKATSDPKRPLEQRAYSPPSSRAPIAHMDSDENEFAVLSPPMTARKDLPAEELPVAERMDKLDLGGEPSLLFSTETVFEAIKASNKEAQRLLQPFKPLAYSHSLNSSSLQHGVKQQATAGAHSLLSPHGQTLVTAASTASTSTSGGLMFSSPLDSRRNVSAVEISNILLEDDEQQYGGGPIHSTGKPHHPQMAAQQNSVDNISMDSSSVDWSPPDSRVHSRRSTLFGTGGKGELALPITVEQLRVLANTPIDLAEEERRDQEKSREVLQQFRDKSAKQLMALFQRRSNCRCPPKEGGPHTEEEECPTAGDEEAGETLAQVLQRLTARHEEKAKVREFGHQGPVATIFDVKFPSSFEM